jgi:uncharacterized protein
MLFALICTDKPDHLALRTEKRPEHLVYLQSLGDGLKAAGPFTDDAGSMNGSLVIISAQDRSEAEMIAARDPYAVAGLFQSVEIRPWLWRVKNPEA